MKLSTLLGLATLGSMLAGPATAGLNGDVVTTVLRAETASYGPYSAVVVAGFEGSILGSLLFDYSDFGFAIQSSSSFCGIRSCSVKETLTLRLSSLDFGPARVLTDVQLTTVLSDVSVTFGPTFAEFSWTDQPIAQGLFLSARFITGVPEPEPVVLMLAGLGLIGLAVRQSGRI